MLLENRLAALRKQAGLSQQDLAERLHVSRQAVSCWESGESMPTVDNLLYLSSIFGVSIDYLLKGDEAHPETEKPAPAQTPPASQPPEAASAVECHQKRRRRWYLVAAVAAVLALLLIVLIVKRDATSSANNETQYGDLNTEDITGQEEITFEFDW